MRIKRCSGGIAALDAGAEQVSFPKMSSVRSLGVENQNSSFLVLSLSLSPTFLPLSASLILCLSLSSSRKKRILMARGAGSGWRPPKQCRLTLRVIFASAPHSGQSAPCGQEMGFAHHYIPGARQWPCLEM